MIIHTFVCGPLATNSYLIGCEVTGKAAVIDPGMGAKDFFIESAKKSKLDIVHIYLTHSHFDHIADAALLKRETDATVYVHPLDAENLRNPGSDLIPFPMAIPPVVPDEFFQDNMDIMLGKLVLQVIHTPGHSPGGVVLFFPKEKTLFSGDTLFKGSIGTISLPSANPKDMWRSLKKIAGFPGDTLVYPGHGGTTTIAKEQWIANAREIYH